MHTHTRTRAHTYTHNIFSMEGMEGVEIPCYKRPSSFHTSRQGMEGMEKMSVHQDFDLPKPVKKSREEVRAEYPASAEIIDAFNAAFGKVTVLSMEEGGKQHRIKNYLAHDPSREVTLAQYEQMGATSAENTKYVNRKDTSAKRN